MSSRSLLLVLLVLACLQFFALAENNSHGPTQCCFTYQKSRIPIKKIAAYEVTERQCTQPGVIFNLKNDRYVCADPSTEWVTFALMCFGSYRDHHPSQYSSPSAAMISPFLLLVLTCLQSFTMANNAKGSEECCFYFAKYKIPVHLIKDYNETRNDCTNRGVIFSLFNGRRLCANPSLEWVQKAIQKIDKRQVEDSTQPVTKVTLK
ncbi:uncharacterized protein LOC128506568 [Clarias gariepinus]|uniref:uncharacterized protein LOC128506568 n=1 Tax=Clarias gariepinus TaxID=13013 RepID=UPI00234DA4C2|nr:uncharacterized protein LOC128506568 [Clarias gariepinus]